MGVKNFRFSVWEPHWERKIDVISRTTVRFWHRSTVIPGASAIHPNDAAMSRIKPIKIKIRPINAATPSMHRVTMPCAYEEKICIPIMFRRRKRRCPTLNRMIKPVRTKNIPFNTKWWKWIIQVYLKMVNSAGKLQKKRDKISEWEKPTGVKWASLLS